MTPARAAALAFGPACIVLAACEATGPLAAYAESPGLALGVFAHMVTFMFASMAGSLAYCAGVVIVELVLGRLTNLDARRLLFARIAAHAALALGLTVYAYRTFLLYEVFGDYPILVVPFIAAFVVVAACGAAVSWTRPRVAFVAILAGLAFVASHAANHIVLGDGYYTFHLSVLQLSLPLLFLSLVALARFRAPSSAVSISVVVASIALLAAAPLAAQLTAARARPVSLRHTLIGRAQVVNSPFTEGSEGPSIPPPSDPEGPALFAARSGMPPSDFKLEDYNVLLIQSEAVRFDKSLADNAQATPHLKALFDSGALLFTNAHSPSSATLTSNAATQSMTYSSAVKLQTWARTWCGELQPDEVTLAELFTQAGYATFRVSHDFHHGFTANLLGFGQGFAEEALFPEETRAEGIDLDHRIAERAIVSLRANKDRRFYGWVYFASPHEPYYARFDDMPSATNEDRYVQELHYMDEQVGLLMDTLRDEGLLDKTIVIFTADHGEELGEHGGAGHKTLYNECTHVPLLVRIPGVEGKKIEALTSTLYLFPWLLLHGSGALHAAAQDRLIHDIGPMMRATKGAVVSEIIGYNNMLSALITPERRIIYDFIADAFVVFDVRSDPLEQHDVVLTGGVTPEDLAAIAAYRSIRQGIHRYTMDPKKRPDLSHRAKKHKKKKKAKEKAAGVAQ